MIKRLIGALLIALMLGFGLRHAAVADAHVPGNTSASHAIRAHVLSTFDQLSGIRIGSLKSALGTNQAARLFYQQGIMIHYLAFLNNDQMAPSTAYQITQKSISPLSNGAGIKTLEGSLTHLVTIISDVKTPDQVAINLSGKDQLNLAEPIVLNGMLKDISTGAGVANKTITFSTNDIYLGQTHTDAQGKFTIEINEDLTAGNYQVTATFKGAHLLAPASNSIAIQIIPADFTIQTVPAIPGITFQMDGQQFVSGQDGTASIQISRVGTYRLDVLLSLYRNLSQQVDFGRWGDENYQPYHDIQIPNDRSIQLGLDIFHQVSMNFVDLDGLPVDPGRITSISIRSIQGDVFTLKPGDTPWLPASRTARRQTGLEVTNLLYSIKSVVMNGSNVVNSAQQRFFVKSDDTWAISLLLYSLHVTAKDGLFASPIGQSVDITLPDGQVQNYALNGSGSVDIHTLPRGIYHVSLPGVKGLGTSTPVALSRNQVVNLNVVTLLDIEVIGALAVGLALGLILYGRPWLLNFLFKRKHSATRKASDINP
jgi:hypothetical protein